MANVGGVFVVLLAGMGLACLIAVFEFIWKSRKLATEDNVRHSQLICKGFSHTSKHSFLLKSKSTNPDDNVLNFPPISKPQNLNNFSTIITTTANAAEVVVQPPSIVQLENYRASPYSVVDCVLELWKTKIICVFYLLLLLRKNEKKIVVKFCK